MVMGCVRLMLQKHKLIEIMILYLIFNNFSVIEFVVFIIYLFCYERGKVDGLLILLRMMMMMGEVKI